MRDLGGGSLQQRGLPLLSFACLLVVAVLGLRARTGDAFSWELRLRGVGVDANARLDAYSDVGDDVIGYFVVFAADAVAVAAVTATAVVLASAGRRLDAAAAVAAVTATTAFVLLLNGLFERPSGAYGNYDLPSGHATRALLAPGILALALWRTRLRSAAVAGTATFATAVGAALVYEDWHLASDVAAGWALALAALTAAAWGARIRDH